MSRNPNLPKTYKIGPNLKCANSILKHNQFLCNFLETRDRDAAETGTRRGNLQRTETSVCQSPAAGGLQTGEIETTEQQTAIDTTGNTGQPRRLHQGQAGDRGGQR